jgi:hypothetical protein
MIWTNLPLNRDDIKYLKKMLLGHSHSTKAHLLKAYAMEWINTFNSSDCEISGENKARFAANKKLRLIMSESIPVKEIPYKCCDNCEHIGANNVCAKYQSEVPTEYLQNENNCEDFIYGIPF